MNRRGFSLVELLIVISLIGILTAIGTAQFSSYTKKANINSQTRALYGDLMEYRTRAFYEKRNWTFKFSANGYGIYSSNNVAVAPVTSVSLKYPVTTTDFTVNVVHDVQGMAEVGASGKKAVCVATANDSTVDSVVISKSRVQIGKKDGSCESANIDAE